MKTMLCLATTVLAMVFAAGCSRKQSVKQVKPADIAISTIATGAKTQSGKSVDAYEVQLSGVPSVILIIGGGKLETSDRALLTLDGQMLAVDRNIMNNKVLVVEKKWGYSFFTIPNATPADAKGKCQAGQKIDLPIDETLAALPAPTGGR
jgi:hypothetical protein